MMYADIIIDISGERLDRSFSYRVPERLEKEIRLGMVVSVPFGQGERLRKGYVIGLSGNTGYDQDKIKEIQEIRNDSRTTESELVDLAAWMTRIGAGT